MNVVHVPGDEILQGVLDRWKAGIDTQQPGRVADVFTGGPAGPGGPGRH